MYSGLIMMRPQRSQVRSQRAFMSVAVECWPCIVMRTGHSRSGV